jgi:hypothetical protein
VTTSDVIFALFVIWFGLGAVLGIAFVGKERKPLTNTTAIIQLVVSVLLIWGSFYLLHH